MGAELIGWQEKRKPRGQSGPGPIKHGMGVAIHKWGGGGGQDKKVACTINPDGSVELQDGDPGPRHGHPHGPGDHRRRGAGAQADGYHLEHRQLDVSARPGIRRLDDDAVDVAAVLRCRDEGPGRAVQEDRPGCQGEPGKPFAQGRPALGRGRAGDGLERRLPQAGHGARSRRPARSSRQLATGRRRPAASLPKSPSTSRPAWSRSRRSSPSRIRA